MPYQMNGTEHLIICLEILEDLGAQLFGEPGGAIASIKRSGVLVPAARLPAAGESFEERETVAQAKIDLLRRRQAQRAAVGQAMEVIQTLVRDLSKAPDVSELLA